MVDFVKANERRAAEKRLEDAGFESDGYCGAIVETNNHGVCGLRQYRTPSGTICADGHGGADTLDTTWRESAKRRKHPTMARTRRRRKASDEPAREEHETAAGEAKGRELDVADVFDPGFEVREGDRLTVAYGGVKLQIAPFSSVEIDSAYYSRTLEVGDDPVEQFNKIRAFLDRKITEKAREKLALYAGELKRAKSKAG